MTEAHLTRDGQIETIADNSMRKSVKSFRLHEVNWAISHREEFIQGKEITLMVSYLVNNTCKFVAKAQANRAERVTSQVEAL